MSAAAGASLLASPLDIAALTGSSTVPVLIDCYTPGCGPCAALAPLLDALAAERGDALIVEKVDVAAHPEVAKGFGVRSVPTLLLFSGGKLAATRTGAATAAQLMTWLAVHNAV